MFLFVYPSDDALHAVDLLAQEDGHGQQRTHAVQGLLDLELDHLFGHLQQHVVDEPVDDLLARLALLDAAALLRLDADDRIQNTLRPATKTKHKRKTIEVRISLMYFFIWFLYVFNLSNWF